MDTPNVGFSQTCTGNGLSFRPGLQNQSWEARHFPRDILFSPQQLVRPALAMCCCWDPRLQEQKHSRKFSIRAQHLGKSPPPPPNSHAVISLWAGIVFLACKEVDGKQRDIKLQMAEGWTHFLPSDLAVSGLHSRKWKAIILIHLESGKGARALGALSLMNTYINKKPYMERKEKQVLKTILATTAIGKNNLLLNA